MSELKLDPDNPQHLRAASRMLSALGPNWQVDASELADIASHYEEQAEREALYAKAREVFTRQLGESGINSSLFALPAVLNALYDVVDYVVGEVE